MTSPTSPTKRYLNRSEKKAVIILSAFIVYLDEFLEAAPRRDKTLLKWIKTARTFANKGLGCFLQPLDNNEKIKILGECEKMEIAARYRRDSLREYQEFLKMDSTVAMEKDDFLDITEQAIGICQQCKKSGDDADNCNLRKIFVKYDIEALDFEAPLGKCQYQYY